MRAGRTAGLKQLHTTFMETFGLSPAVSLSAIFFIASIVCFAVFWFFHSAPPNTITITSGPEGSVFQVNAEKYKKILARNGVKLNILPSQGSLENLSRLNDPSYSVDIGFVQSGVASGMNTDTLVSLGSISYEPLLVFYRGSTTVDLLSQLDGMRLAIGPVGSGTRSLALTLLAANGIQPGGTTKLEDLDGEDAAKALMEGNVDAAFLMGDSASVEIMRKLLQSLRIHLFNFTQADGYARRIGYLNKLELPQGSIDFGKNIPAHTVDLIAPTVELIARADLHPALSDLLLEAAGEVHGRAGLFKRRGEFPAPLELDFPLSADAIRYYKSGKGFLYRMLPFWLATLVNRFLWVIVPLVVVLIPGFKLIPSLFRWRIMVRIYRWYRKLLALEQDLIGPPALEKQKELLERLDHIEKEVNRMKVPASFADQFYVLRGHINFVRDRLTDNAQSSQGEEIRHFEVLLMRRL